jgi:hypothetical protein
LIRTFLTVYYSIVNDEYPLSLANPGVTLIRPLAYTIVDARKHLALPELTLMSVFFLVYVPNLTGRQNYAGIPTFISNKMLVKKEACK